MYQHYPPHVRGLNIFFIGSDGSGITALRRAFNFAHNTVFGANDFQSLLSNVTITTPQTLMGERVRVAFWDYRTPRSFECSISHPCRPHTTVIAFDPQLPDALNNIKKLIKEVARHLSLYGDKIKNVSLEESIVIVLTKQDRALSLKAAEIVDACRAYAKEHHIYFVETSAKTGFNIQDTYKLLMLLALSRPNKNEVEAHIRQHIAETNVLQQTISVAQLKAASQQRHEDTEMLKSYPSDISDIIAGYLGEGTVTTTYIQNRIDALERQIASMSNPTAGDIIKLEKLLAYLERNLAVPGNTSRWHHYAPLLQRAYQEQFAQLKSKSGSEADQAANLLRQIEIIDQRLERLVATTSTTSTTTPSDDTRQVLQNQRRFAFAAYFQLLAYQEHDGLGAPEISNLILIYCDPTLENAVRDDFARPTSAITTSTTHNTELRNAVVEKIKILEQIAADENYSPESMEDLLNYLKLIKETQSNDAHLMQYVDSRMQYLKMWQQSSTTQNYAPQA